MGGLSTPVSLTTFTDHNPIARRCPAAVPTHSLRQWHLPSKLEEGASYPGLEIIGKLATVLEVEPAELLRISPARLSRVAIRGNRVLINNALRIRDTSSREASDMTDLDPERFTLRQAAQARDDFAQVMDELDFVKELIARLPTRRDQAFVPLRTMLGSAVLSAALVIGWIELFWRHCL
jgi:hypothetical protein